MVIQLSSLGRILMVNPRDHRVVVIESLLCPTHFRNTLARVLFNHLSVSQDKFTISLTCSLGRVFGLGTAQLDMFVCL